MRGGGRRGGNERKKSGTKPSDLAMLNSYYHMADQIFVMKNAEEKVKEALVKFVKQ